MNGNDHEDNLSQSPWPGIFENTLSRKKFAISFEKRFAQNLLSPAFIWLPVLTLFAYFLNSSSIEIWKLNQTDTVSPSKST